MAPIKTALAGGTGLLGPLVLRALLEAQHPIVLLTRPSSKQNHPSSPLLTIKEVDYNDVASLTELLKSEKVEAVVSTLGIPGFPGQTNLIKAAFESGTVKRFLPSEFGSDTNNANNSVLPVYGGKVAAQNLLKDLASQNSAFTYTFFLNNLFFDSGLKSGFIVNAAKHTARVFDGGDVPVSVTRLSTVGKGVAGVLAHLDETANTSVYIHDTVTSQNELISLIKDIDGKSWDITEADSEQLKQDSFAELKKDKPDIGKAIVGFLPNAIYGKQGGGDFTGKVFNDLLGIPVLSKSEVKDLVNEIVSGTYEY